MFDVRPVDKAGNLDLEKIKKTNKIIHLRENKNAPKVIIRKKFLQRASSSSSKYFSEEPLKNNFSAFDEEAFYAFIGREKKIPKKARKDARHFSVRPVQQFALACLTIFLLIMTPIFISRGLQIKDRTLKNSQLALTNLVQAKDKLTQLDFSGSTQSFEEAQKEFELISADLNRLGNVLTESGRVIPFLSKATSGKYLAQAGEKVSRLGILLSQTMGLLNQVKDPLNNVNQEISLLDVFKKTNDNLQEITELFTSIEEDLEKVNVDDLPEENQTYFAEIKNKLPEATAFLNSFVKDSQIFNDILGGNGPRKFLFLFQNNHEMRATGGFIGTYATLEIFNGRIKNLKVDGIFNPDGQLKEKVVPPKPIQKISAAWSLHDSNWWPDFPSSAEKATWFWGKTGGPTVDGVIAMTPQVLKSFLTITGPIALPEYGKIIREDNFMAEVQQEVEVDYDKEENKPKKILADLAPKILDNIFNTKDITKLLSITKILGDNLAQKHILLYSTNYNIQKMISTNGWSGELLSTQKDYLSVINTNINGYKTDGVVDETIKHEAEIKSDGSIIDTVSITRHHNGGKSQYEWFNKVNADYQRIYVPKGSKLISVSGQTREFNSSPIDYEALNFRKDPQVLMEEQNMLIDEESGTRIYEEKDKTVFANWVYVSPQEDVTITYQYQLPFKISFQSDRGNVDSYSLLVQKQSGSIGSNFSSRITIPKEIRNIWKFPETNFKKKNDTEFYFEDKLKTDKFLGLALEEKND